MGSVDIELANGQLGNTEQTADGVVAMVLTGGIDDGGYVLGTPIQINRLQDLETNGITESGNAFAVKEVKDFYNGAGDGAVLYLMLTPNTLTVADMADKNNAYGAKALLDYGDGAIKLIGMMSDDTQVPVTSTAGGINDDVFTAIHNLQVMLDSYASLEEPLRGIIGGTSYQGVPANLTNITTGNDKDRVAVLIGDSVAGTGAGIGMLLGRAARVSVEEKISYVGRGSIAGVTTAYLGDDTVKAKKYDHVTIDSKGYITLRQYPRKSGFFFSSDRMATASTSDYRFLCNGRVIDKAHVLAYDYFIDNVDGKVPQKENKIDSGFALNLQKGIEKTIDTTMISKGQATAVTCLVPINQEVTADSEMDVNLGVTPYGYSSTIKVKLGFKK